MLKEPKVFCIGFHKTGTSSMRDALRLLGYGVTGPNGTKDPEIATKLEAMVDELSEQFDAFQDNPWPLVYRRMDVRHPGSKFILTTRDPDKWFNSAVGYFGQDSTPMRAMIYGVANPRGQNVLYKNRFKKHNSEVIEYFKKRPGDLLIIDLSNGDNWAKLCSFIGADCPSSLFPHANERKPPEEKSPVKKLKRFLRRMAHLGR